MSRWQKGREHMSTSAPGLRGKSSSLEVMAADVEIDRPLMLLERLRWEKYGRPRAMQEALSEPDKTMEQQKKGKVRLIVICGERQRGKSLMLHKVCRQLGERVYYKGVSSWWDGYRGEPTIAMDFDERDPDQRAVQEIAHIVFEGDAALLNIKGGYARSSAATLVVASPTANWSVDLHPEAVIKLSHESDFAAEMEKLRA